MPEDLVPGGDPQDFDKPPAPLATISLSVIESATAFIEGNPKNDTPFADLNRQIEEAAKEQAEDEPGSDN